MAVTKAQKFRLGVFVTTAAILLFGGIILLAGMKFIEQRDYYTIRIQDANTSLSGLDLGSAVKYSGLKIGRVEAVHVDPNDVSVIVVTISLDHGTPVAENSTANLGSMGITGLKFIELTRGSKDARVRKPGEDIPAGQSLIDDLTSQAGDIADKVNDVLAQVRDLTNPEMQKKISTALDHVNNILSGVNGIIEENRGTIQQIVQELNSSANQASLLLTQTNGTFERVNKLLDKVSRILEHADGSIDLIEPTLKEVKGLIKDTRTLLGPDGAQKVVQSVDLTLNRASNLIQQTRDNLVETIRSARDVAENLAIFSEKVKDDPSLLIMGESDGDPN